MLPSSPEVRRRDFALKPLCEANNSVVLPRIKVNMSGKGLLKYFNQATRLYIL